MEENIKTRRNGNIDSDLLEILIIEYRDNNLSLRKIQEKYNVNRHKVAKILEEKGIKTTKGNHYRYNFYEHSTEDTRIKRKYNKYLKIKDDE